MKRGFAVVMVLLAIVVIGAETAVLASMARQLYFQSQRAYVQAFNHNLEMSGAAWAHTHAGALGQKQALDTSQLSDGRTKCSLEIRRIDANSVEIVSSARWGKIGDRSTLRVAVH
jgi:hypothetical protein